MKQMSIGIDLQLLQESENAPSTSAHVTNLISRLKQIHETVKQNMDDSGQRAKRFYDVDTETPQITVGAKVLLHSNVLKPGQSAKFHKPWTGPYLVISKTDDGLLYTLRHCDTGKSLRSAVHANRIKLFESDRDMFYNRQILNQTILHRRFHQIRRRRQQIQRMFRMMFGTRLTAY